MSVRKNKGSLLEGSSSLHKHVYFKDNRSISRNDQQHPPLERTEAAPEESSPSCALPLERVLHYRRNRSWKWATGGGHL
jgi:hypothetical protein